MSVEFFLETERLFIRPWAYEKSDREIFHKLNSDKAVMEFFPFRRSPKQADEAMERINQNFVTNGYSWCAVCLKETGEPIGFSGLAKVDFSERLRNDVEIGWRILPNHWRKGYASEAATKLLSYGFETLELEKIIAFAVPQNSGSTAVMKNIGMSPRPELDFDHPGVGEEYSHLRRHVYYEIKKTTWRAQNQQAI